MKEEEINQLINIVNMLLNKFVSKERLPQVLKVFDQYGALYFTSPASSKESYHYAFPGGLAKHSLNVYNNLIKLNNTFKCQFTDEQMLIAALFHDFGKCVATTLTDPHYVPSTDNWRKEKLGELYVKNDIGVYFPNHQRTLFAIQAAGLTLTDVEYQAILLNDGQYLEENKGYKMKECKLALFLHIADRIACEQESEKS